jgi:hypothetical protein
MEALFTPGMTYCKSHSALAAGTTTTFSTTGATLYDIQGKSYTTSAAANAATPTTDARTGAAFLPVGLNKASVFVFCYDGSSTTAASAIKVVQGSIVDLDGTADGAAAGYVNALPQFPSIPDNLCPFGYMTLKNGSGGAAFTFGAQNLAAVTNVGKTFVSIGTLPDRPQA